MSNAPKPKPTGEGFSHNWYLREWMQVRRKRQVNMQRELGWSKGKANEVYNGQRYTQDLIDVLAPWLKIEHYELLMHPTVAMSVRRMREAAQTIVADKPAPFREDWDEVFPTANRKY
jgi:hypothetical protein